jgi:hypothetical protein
MRYCGSPEMNRFKYCPERHRACHRYHIGHVAK